MKKIKIHISGVYDITQFVEHAAKVESQGVNVYKGKIMLDGASLMGMLALDTSPGIEVEYPDNAKDFEDFLQQFVKE